LIGYFNVEVAKYEATSNAENLRGASKTMDDNLSAFGKIAATLGGPFEAMCFSQLLWARDNSNLS
jgi:hypothetical protein